MVSVELVRSPEVKVADDGSLVDEPDRVVALVQSAAWHEEDEVLDERVVGAEWLAVLSLFKLLM